MLRLTLEQAEELAQAILRRHGFSEAYVRAIGATLLAGERDGCTSHGLWRLLGIVQALRAGKVEPCAEPQVHDQAPGVVRVDARAGFPSWPLPRPAVAGGQGPGQRYRGFGD